MSIAENIKSLRSKFGLTQAQLGDIAGVSDKAVWTWENGTAEPRMGAIQKIADHFHIKKSDIVDDAPFEDTIIDIDAELNSLLTRIEGGKSISIHGETLDDNTKELLVDSLTNTLKLINAISKKP